MYPLLELWSANSFYGPAETNIPSGGQNGWQYCEVNINSSWYLGCDGSRLRSSQYLTKMKEMFSFQVSAKNVPGLGYPFALKVRRNH